MDKKEGKKLCYARLYSYAHIEADTKVNRDKYFSAKSTGKLNGLQTKNN